MKNVRYMVYSGIFAALMGVCAWIHIPVPGGSFTLQLLAVFLALTVLGGKWGTVSILTYLLLGCVGLPVFSGFQSGFGVLMGPTGGFLLGFLAIGLVYWLFPGTPGLVLGWFLCYGLGCWWYRRLYQVGWQAAFFACVVPYLVPDGLKLALALSLGKKLKRQVKL